MEGRIKGNRYMAVGASKVEGMARLRREAMLQLALAGETHGRGCQYGRGLLITS
jgi:hypothetical protein